METLHDVCIDIKKIDISEFDYVLSVYKNAVQKLIQEHIFQWDEVYPDEATLRADIAENSMYAGIIKKEIVSLFILNHTAPPQYMLGEWRYNNFIILHRLCVNPVYQNKGIGTNTVQKIEEFSRQKGFESIRLDAFSQNPVALKMYEKLKYRKTGEVTARKGIFYLFEKKL
jgi:ribosomal protein S18 acetylase RimI-like enzyme